MAKKNAYAMGDDTKPGKSRTNYEVCTDLRCDTVLKMRTDTRRKIISWPDPSGSVNFDPNN